MLERESNEISIKTQCELLGINRSGTYYIPHEVSAEEVKIKHEIDKIYTSASFYGSRRITAQMQREGWAVNRKAVQRHMQEMGISGICPGPNLSRTAAKAKIYPYLLRNLAITAVNQVWGIDITYIRMQKSWMYLVAILDWHSRYVLAWQVDETLEMPFVIETVERSLRGGKPQIMNSDQGSHFTSPQYLEPLLKLGIQISMDGKGRALDNIFTERLWRTVKYEDIYLHDYVKPRDLVTGLGAYFPFYNHRRLHQSLDYRTPAEVYFQPVISTNSDNNLPEI
jgi:putative transposase